MTLFPLFLMTCAVAGASGFFFRPGQWYSELDKPSWTPPNWLFPVAWTILYLLMALAAARIAGSPDPALALALWTLQITLNTLWSGVFFGLHRMLTGGAILTLLWLAVLATTIVFWADDMLAGVMMLPYLIWTSYAWALNTVIWWRNRHRVMATA